MQSLASQIAKDVRICENGPWMIPSALTLPAGDEHGTVLVIGIGGSTLRLTRVHIEANTASARAADIMSTEITPEARAGNLFRWCAAQLVPHIQQNGGSNPPPLAISWSFPLIKGRIQTMGKTFSDRYVGRDLLEAFNSELPPGIHIDSATHDGLSSLVAGAHASPHCFMALTLGTGLNVTLVGSNGELINSEVSMLGRPDLTPGLTLPTEPWDITGPAADFQPFEARIGGLWLGPMASNARGEATTTLDLWRILDDLNHKDYAVVDHIVNRAASFVASSLYGLTMAFSVPKADPQKPREVAYTGGVVFEPQFRTRLETALATLAAHFGFALRLTPQQQGSEVGTAIAALAALKKTVINYGNY